MAKPDPKKPLILRWADIVIVADALGIVKNGSGRADAFKLGKLLRDTGRVRKIARGRYEVICKKGETQNDDQA